MNRKELTLVLAHRLKITQIEAKRLTDNLFDVLIQKIASGEPVKLSGFGTFQSRQKLRGSFRKRIVFHPGKVLKESINEQSEDHVQNDFTKINHSPPLAL
ncbi:MAG: HU family DNA-binding protein [Clostridiales bacterium]|nr:HU family DNA-binding protein [Clostridiales bacterium]